MAAGKDLAKQNNKDDTPDTSSNVRRGSKSIWPWKKQTDGSASFLRAARAGNLEKVLEFLKTNTDINTCNANGLNALHLASKEGHVNVVSALLERNANVDSATKKGNTALHIASLAGQDEIVKVLVESGASVNIQSQNGFTPLYMAAQENHDSVVRFLLSHGANQSLATEDGFTPLAVALQQGHDRVVSVLLENDTRGKVRLPALHIAAKKDDAKAAALLLHTDHNPDITSKSGFTPLHIASHYGNDNIAALLIQRGADVNYVAKHQITPLHVASKWGKGNMVSLLLDKGANIEAKTRDGLTPLHCAARSGHETVVDMLLEKGAPITAKTKNGLAPLHMASQGDHVDAARILLYHKAPVDDVTVDFLTALHVAAHCGHVRVAKLLLDRKADPNARALNGFTPLHIACKKNRIKVVELLLKHGASIEATTESGLTPLHVASFMGCMNIVIYLIQHGASADVPTVRGESPLHLAARANQTDIIRILLRNGAEVDAKAREQQTALHIASRLGNADIVGLLLQQGASVDAPTKDLYTPLHIAAKEGQEEVAGVLLDHGASLNTPTKKGFTPLHLAAKYGHMKVARLLLQRDAPVDPKGKNGVTPLHVAAHYDHQNVALLLLDKGAQPHATAKNGYTPLHIAARKNQMDIAGTLLEYGANANAESKAGFTPLHLSAQEGHTDMATLLIEHGAEPTCAAKNGLTPLHLCAQEDRVPVAAVMVKHGAPVDAQTKAGYTPLHVASHFGQMNMVRFLLQHGTRVDATTQLGYTPLHQAAQQGHTQIVNLLLENKAQPNMETNDGKTALSIAQRLGYISVVETLKVVTETRVTTNTTTTTEEKYKVVVPETMHETFMSESEDEGADDTMLGDQSYRYLTVDEMKSLGDDSLPIDVTKDEKMDVSFQSNVGAGVPVDHISPQHKELLYTQNYPADNVDVAKAPILAGPESLNTTMNTSYNPTEDDQQIVNGDESRVGVPDREMTHSSHDPATGTHSNDSTLNNSSEPLNGWDQFLVSFMVDARGGAMRGCRHSGVRVIIPPRKAAMPMRITCRYLKKDKLVHAPPLMEGEALASRILEMGPSGAKFLGPVIIEVPHFASLRGKEREIVILRSDNGETWREHTLEATEEAVQEVLNESFDGEELKQLEDLNTNRITRILTTDFPQYFAIVTRIRQEVHAIGPEGGMVSSTVVPQVQAVFPQGALTKKIKVGLQAQPINTELVAKLLGNRVAVSPIVTVEPRRRKFHKPITLTIPVPQAASKGMINQYSGEAPTLRLLCSITGGTTRAQWEDVTGSTPLTFVNDCVSFTTTVSARFWLMDCTNIPEATKMATELYREAIHVPFMAKFVVFSKRHAAEEARVRVFCMTDDKEDKTLETQEHFVEVAKSRDVEVLEGKTQYLEFAGNLIPVTKSGDQLAFNFYAFRENRLPFTVRVKDPNAESVGRVAFMRQPKVGRGEAPQSPICNLNLSLPDNIQPEPAPSEPDLLALEKKYAFLSISKTDTIHKADLRLSDISNMLAGDWVALAKELDVSDSDINIIKSQYPDNIPQQAIVMLRLWMQTAGNKATGNTLEKGLRTIHREDIVDECICNLEEVTDDREKAMAKEHLEQSDVAPPYDEKDILKESESADEEDESHKILQVPNTQDEGVNEIEIVPEPRSTTIHTTSQVVVESFGGERLEDVAEPVRVQKVSESEQVEDIPYRSSPTPDLSAEVHERLPSDFPEELDVEEVTSSQDFTTTQESDVLIAGKGHPTEMEIASEIPETQVQHFQEELTDKKETRSYPQSSEDESSSRVPETAHSEVHVSHEEDIVSEAEPKMISHEIIEAEMEMAPETPILKPEIVHEQMAKTDDLIIHETSEPKIEMPIEESSNIKELEHIHDKTSNLDARDESPVPEDLIIPEEVSEPKDEMIHEVPKPTFKIDPEELPESSTELTHEELISRTEHPDTEAPTAVIPQRETVVFKEELETIIPEDVSTTVIQEPLVQHEERISTSSSDELRHEAEPIIKDEELIIVSGDLREKEYQVSPEPESEILQESKQFITSEPLEEKSIVELDLGIAVEDSKLVSETSEEVDEAAQQDGLTQPSADESQMVPGAPAPSDVKPLAPAAEVTPTEVPPPMKAAGTGASEKQKKYEERNEQEQTPPNSPSKDSESSNQIVDHILQRDGFVYLCSSDEGRIGEYNPSENISTDNSQCEVQVPAETTDFNTSHKFSIESLENRADATAALSEILSHSAHRPTTLKISSSSEADENENKSNDPSHLSGTNELGDKVSCGEYASETFIGSHTKMVKTRPEEEVLSDSQESPPKDQVSNEAILRSERLIRPSTRSATVLKIKVEKRPAVTHSNRERSCSAASFKEPVQYVPQSSLSSTSPSKSRKKPSVEDEVIGLMAEVKEVTSQIKKEVRQLRDSNTPTPDTPTPLREFREFLNREEEQDLERLPTITETGKESEEDGPSSIASGEMEFSLTSKNHISTACSSMNTEQQHFSNEKDHDYTAPLSPSHKVKANNISNKDLTALESNANSFVVESLMPYPVIVENVVNVDSHPHSLSNHCKQKSERHSFTRTIKSHFLSSSDRTGWDISDLLSSAKQNLFSSSRSCSYCSRDFFYNDICNEIGDIISFAEEGIKMSNNINIDQVIASLDTLKSKVGNMCSNLYSVNSMSDNQSHSLVLNESSVIQKDRKLSERENVSVENKISSSWPRDLYEIHDCSTTMPVFKPTDTEKQPFLTISSPGNEANGPEALTDVEDLLSDADQTPKPSPSKVGKNTNDESEAPTDEDSIEVSGDEIEEKDHPPVEIQQFLPDPQEVLSLTEGYARIASPLLTDNEEYSKQDIEGRHVKNVKRTTEKAKALEYPEVPEGNTDEENLCDSENEVMFHEAKEDDSTLPDYYLYGDKSVSDHEIVKAVPPVSKLEFGCKKSRTPEKKAALAVHEEGTEGTTDVEELTIEPSERPKKKRTKRRKTKKAVETKTLNVNVAPPNDEEGITDTEILGDDSSLTSETSEDFEDNFLVPEKEFGELTDTEDVHASDIDDGDLLPKPIPKESHPSVPEVYSEHIRIRDNEGGEIKEDPLVDTDEEGFQIDDHEDKRPLIMPVVNYDISADERDRESDTDVDSKEEDVLTDLDDINIDDKEDKDIMDDIVSRVPKEDSDILLTMESISDFVTSSKSESPNYSQSQDGGDKTPTLTIGDEKTEALTDVEEWDEKGSVTKVKKVQKPKITTKKADTDSTDDSEEDAPSSKNRSKKSGKRSKRLPLVPQISDVKFVKTSQGPLSIVITPEQSNWEAGESIKETDFLEASESEAPNTDIEDIGVPEKAIAPTLNFSEPEDPLTDTEDIEGFEPSLEDLSESPLPHGNPSLPSPKRERIHIVEDEFGVPRVHIEELKDADLATAEESQVLTDLEDIEASEDEIPRIGENINSDGEASDILAKVDSTEVSTKTKNKKSRKSMSSKLTGESGHTDIEELSPYKKLKHKKKQTKKTTLEADVNDESGNTDVELLDDSKALNMPIISVQNESLSSTDYEDFEASGGEEVEIPTLTCAPTPDIIRKSAVKRTVVYKELPSGTIKTEVQEENQTPNFLVLGEEATGTTDVEDVEISEGEEAKEEPAPKTFTVGNFLDDEQSNVSVSVKCTIPHSKEAEEAEIKDNLLLPEDNQGIHTEIESLDEGEETGDVEAAPTDSSQTEESSTEPEKQKKVKGPK